MEASLIDQNRGHGGTKRPREADGEAAEDVPHRRVSETCSASTCTSGAREVERIHSALPARPVHFAMPCAETADGLLGIPGHDIKTDVHNGNEAQARPTGPVGTVLRSNGFQLGVTPDSARPGPANNSNEQGTKKTFNVEGPGRGCSDDGRPRNLPSSSLTMGALQQQLDIVLGQEQNLLAELRLLRREYDARVAALLQGPAVERTGQPAEQVPRPSPAPAPTGSIQAPPTQALPLVAQQQQLLQLLQQQREGREQQQQQQQHGRQIPQERRPAPHQQQQQPAVPPAPARAPPSASQTARALMPPPPAMTSHAAQLRALRQGHVGSAGMTAAVQPAPLGPSLWEAQANAPHAVVQHRRVRLPLDVSHSLHASASAAPPFGKAPVARSQPPPRYRTYAERPLPAAVDGGIPAGRGGVHVHVAAGPDERALLESQLLHFLLLLQQGQQVV